MTRGTAIRAAIIAFWILTTVLFIRDAFPHLFTSGARGYRDIFPRDILVKDSWMKVLIKGNHAGYLHTRIETDEQNVVLRYKVQNEMDLTLNLLGNAERISTETVVFLDLMYKLQKFSLRVSHSLGVAQIEGRRRDGNMFLVRIKGGGTPRIMNVEIPDDVIMYSEKVDQLVLRLKPGEEMPIKTLNPLDFTPVTARVKALPRETIDFKGTKTNVSAFAMEYLGSSAKSWVGDDGTIVRQQLLGDLIIAEACEPSEAFKYVQRPGAASDLLRDLAVKSDKPVARPRECKALELRLYGAATDQVARVSRQSIREATNGAFILDVTSAIMPENPVPVGTYPAEYEVFTRPSAFIQSDDPDIIAAARNITRHAANSAEAAKAICDWVYSSVEKRISPGIPSAADVLRTRKGDCNEHTYLFVALARAAGLPAQVTVGVTYSESYGAFYYHAWPSVYVGTWVEMEPTFGMHTVDATHIALLQGDLGDQLALAQLMGRLRIEIIKQEVPAK